jgi:hypothetical protein
MGCFVGRMKIFVAASPRFITFAPFEAFLAGCLPVEHLYDDVLSLGRTVFLADLIFVVVDHHKNHSLRTVYPKGVFFMFCKGKNGRSNLRFYRNDLRRVLQFLLFCGKIGSYFINDRGPSYGTVFGLPSVFDEAGVGCRAENHG